MVVNFNVFCSGVKNRVNGHIESTFVITKELRCVVKRDANVTEKVSDPYQLSCSASHSSIFGLRA